MVDGDEMIALAALRLREAESAGRRRGNRDDQLRLPPGDGASRDRGATTKVGDRYVLEELVGGWTLGGEQSGHIIWTGFAPTGDGTPPRCSISGPRGRSPRAIRSRSSHSGW